MTNNNYKDGCHKIGETWSPAPAQRTPQKWLLWTKAKRNLGTASRGGEQFRQAQDDGGLPEGSFREKNYIYKIIYRYIKYLAGPLGEASPHCDSECGERGDDEAWGLLDKRQENNSLQKTLEREPPSSRAPRRLSPEELLALPVPAELPEISRDQVSLPEEQSGYGHLKLAPVSPPSLRRPEVQRLPAILLPSVWTCTYFPTTPQGPPSPLPSWETPRSSRTRPPPACDVDSRRGFPGRRGLSEEANSLIIAGADSRFGWEKESNDLSLFFKEKALRGKKKKKS